MFMRGVDGTAIIRGESELVVDLDGVVDVDFDGVGKPMKNVGRENGVVVDEVVVRAVGKLGSKMRKKTVSGNNAKCSGVCINVIDLEVEGKGTVDVGEGTVVNPITRERG